MTKLIKYFRLDSQEQLLFLEALFLVFAAKLLLLVLPFRHCRKILSDERSRNEKPEAGQLVQIKKAIYRTRWLAFWKNQCLVMSIASRWMLQRRHIASLLSLGVAFDENKKLIAHAWLSTADFHIVDKGSNYYELFRF